MVTAGRDWQISAGACNVTRRKASRDASSTLALRTSRKAAVCGDPPPERHAKTTHTDAGSRPSVKPDNGVAPHRKQSVGSRERPAVFNPLMEGNRWTIADGYRSRRRSLMKTIV